MIEYANQLAELRAQVEQMENMFNAMSGNKGFGTTQYDTKYREYLPKDWQEAYDAVRSGGVGELSGDAKAIYNSVKKFDVCNSDALSGEEKIACQASAIQAAMRKANAKAAFAKAHDRLEQIEALMRKIPETEDVKGIAELQARIAIEQAAIDNEMTRFKMYEQVAQAEEAILQQQQHELTVKSNRLEELESPTPIEW
ncbi:hypothetical protein AGMMS49960_10850 [Betaproteobacteria bacterium]|nr:hypothetical protein AGMMS49543_13070 [Betaproteobacteria bacterium]GHU01167.1 hypothetical protein AGMMS49960_10850 [Betaproteobacteria bacterium]GHU21491.1 hypothetical protein AGMMS50243_19300 [Betaproteobacteria bacterium]